MNVAFDYIIIGAGSAGCVLADRLSENPKTSVLLLEAGRSDRNPFLHVPAGVLRISDRYKWRYSCEPDPSRHGQSDIWEAGKVLGGTSTINGMVWVRGNRADYDRWAVLGCTGWDFNSVLPYFRRAETFEGGEDELRGGSGPQHVSTIKVRHELTDAFIEAAQGLGHPFNPDYNGADQRGVGYQQVSQKRGLRHSTARAFLSPAKRRPNLRLVKGAFVHRLLIEGDRCTGAVYEHQGRLVTERSEREVILSAGTVGSAKVLLLSGIGPADELATCGVDVRVDLPGVGRNLQDHLGNTLFYEVNVRTLNREVTPWSLMRGTVDLALHGSGIASASYAHAVLFASLAGERIDYKVAFSPFGITAALHASRNRQRYALMKRNAISISANVLHPNARGTVTLRSADPHEPPVIRHEYASDSTDVAALVHADRHIRELVAVEPINRYVIREIEPGASVQSDDEWEAKVREIGRPGNHPGGTCRMGVGPLAVVDPNLRVHGVAGLRVIDLSVVPTLPSGNTNAATIMIAERGSSLLLQG